jgi:hypothetical protein
MTSFYVRSPSGFLMECGWGGLLIDPDRWQAGEMTAGGSIWGHQSMQDGQLVADAYLPPSPNRALRAPLQVHGKNFEMGHHAIAQSQVLKTEPLTDNSQQIVDSQVARKSAPRIESRGR